MDNNFHKLAEQFADENPDIVDHIRLIEDWYNDEGIDMRIRQFVAHQGIDPAWEDELVEVITEHLEEVA